MSSRKFAASEVTFVGLDVHRDSITEAVLEPGREAPIVVAFTKGRASVVLLRPSVTNASCALLMKLVPPALFDLHAAVPVLFQVLGRNDAQEVKSIIEDGVLEGRTHRDDRSRVGEELIEELVPFGFRGPVDLRLSLVVIVTSPKRGTQARCERLIKNFQELGTVPRSGSDEAHGVHRDDAIRDPRRVDDAPMPDHPDTHGDLEKLLVEESRHVGPDDPGAELD